MQICADRFLPGSFCIRWYLFRQRSAPWLLPHCTSSTHKGPNQLHQLYLALLSHCHTSHVADPHNSQLVVCENCISLYEIMTRSRRRARGIQVLYVTVGSTNNMHVPLPYKTLLHRRTPTASAHAVATSPHTIPSGPSSYRYALRSRSRSRIVTMSHGPRFRINANDG